MPLFVVEDGTALSDSNSYGALDEANSYHEARGNWTWLELSPNKKQESLVLATDYLDGRFGPWYVGYLATEEQALGWPRIYTGITSWDYINGSGIIPRELKYACFEYAFRASQSPLAPDPVISDTGVPTVVTMEKVGEIQREYQTLNFQGGNSIQLIRPYPSADFYMQGLLRAGYGNGRVIR